MKIYIVDLESGMPTVQQARIRLEEGLRTARSQNHAVIKFIHGYGSTGKGGKIKQDAQSFLKEQKIQGKITNFVTGDNFSPFDATTRKILETHPNLYKDKDYSKSNSGITIVIM